MESRWDSLVHPRLFAYPSTVMGRQPEIPHDVIAKFILAGNTTAHAKEHFGFSNDNVANLRIHAAFKALGIVRPRFAEERACEFCGKSFTARDRLQRSCGNQSCQEALIRHWQKKNPNKVQQALRKYRATDKGRLNNQRMHAKRRELGKAGTNSERWNFAAAEAKKSLRKLKSLATRNAWEYRIQHIQKMSQMEREVRPRNKRQVLSASAAGSWQIALRAVQTTLIQTCNASTDSAWGRAVQRISGAIRMGHNIRNSSKQI